jgi:phage-related protein
VSDTALIFDVIGRDIGGTRTLRNIGREAGKTQEELDKLSTQDRLDKVRKQLDEIAKRTTTARVDVNDQKALDQMDKVKLRLLQLSKTIANPKVRPEGIVKAEIEIRMLNRQLDEMDRKNVSPKVDVAGALKSLSTLTGGMNAWVLAAAALGPALVPLTAGLTAAVGGLAVPFAAATAGVAGFAAFAIPAFKSVTDASTKLAEAQKRVDDALTSKARQTALVRQKQLIADLSPAQLQAASALDKLKTAYKSFSTALAPQMLTLFAAGLRAATAALPLLATLAQAVAPALTTLSNLMTQAFASPGMKRFVAFLAAQAGPAILSFGVILANLAEGFGKLLMAFAPIGSSLLDGLVRMSQAFATMTASDGFQRFLAYAVATLPAVGRFLGDVVRGVGALLVALAPLGGVVLKGLDLLVVGITWLARQVPVLVPAVVALVAAFGLLRPVAAALAFLASPIGLIIVGVALLAAGFLLLYRHSAPLRALMAGIGHVLQELGEKALPVLRRIFTQAMEGIRAGLGIVSKAIGDNRPQLAQLVAAFKTVVSFIITRVLPVLGPVLKAVFMGIAVSVGTTLTVIGFLVRTFNAAKTAVVALVAGVVLAWNAIRTAVRVSVAAVVGFVQGMWNWLRGAFNAGVAVVRGVWHALWASTIGQLVAAVVGLIVASVQFMWAAIGVAFRAGSSVVRSVVSSAFGLVRSVISSVMSAVMAVVHAVWPRIASVVSSAVATVLAVVHRVGAVAGIIGGAFRSAWSAATTWIGRVVSAAGGIGGKIVRAVGNLGRTLYNAGARVVQGLIDGIVSKIKAVTDAIHRVTGAIAGAVPGSPVKTGPLRVLNHGRAGGLIATMIADGITGRADVVAAAIHGALGADLTAPALVGPPRNASGALLAAAGSRMGITINIQNVTLPSVTDPPSFVRGLQDYVRANGPIRGLTFG